MTTSEAASTLTIDRRSAIPFYAQLMDLLAAYIESHGLEAGDRMPGEHELCSTYDVSRTVVRQALQGLERQGLIRRDKGRGTFVGDPHTARGIGAPLVGAFEDIQSDAGQQHTRVLTREILPASTSVAHDLQLEIGEQVVQIERVREVDGIAWALTRTQLPMAVGEPLLTASLEDVSLFGILERDYNVQFQRARRSIEAAVADERIATVLSSRPGAPVLVMRSVSYDRDDRPVERFTGYHRGDRSRMDIEVVRNTQ